MDIYCGTAENVYGSFLAAEALKPGKRRSLLTTLPPHTLSEECLSRLLEKNGVPDSDGRRMLEACAQMKGFVAAMLDNGSYEEEFPVLTQKEFGQESVSVAMSEAGSLRRSRLLGTPAPHTRLRAVAPRLYRPGKWSWRIPEYSDIHQ